MRTTFIYSLNDPRTNIPRYIGKTNRLSGRLYQHKNDSRTNHKTCWIRSLKLNGLLPLIDVIDVVPHDEWQFWERHYISLYKSWGFDLTNHAMGGEGTEHDEDTRKIMSEIKKEYYQNNVPYWTGKKRTEDTVTKVREKIMKTVLQYDLYGNFIKEWECAKTVEKELLNITDSSICKACNQKRMYAGFLWSYKEGEVKKKINISVYKLNIQCFSVAVL